jgi:aryl-alcohol dehydrogenase-like predicted oxidoreductase
MQYARLGDTGLIVSRLALGTLAFGDGAGSLASLYKVNQAGANGLIDQALAAGINYFNTADNYCEGRSEQMLGIALGKRRKHVVIATKVGTRFSPALLDEGLSRRHIIASAEQSLQRLGTDWIDVYLLHRTDPHTPLEETLSALEHLVTTGKVRYVGFSNWPAWLAAKAVQIQRARGWEPFRIAEMYYSLVGRDLEHEVVPMAVDSGIGLQIWSPLAGGFLSGGGRRRDFDFTPFDRERGDRILDCVRAVALERGATPAQVAIAWLLNRPAVTSVLLGVSREQQLADNLGATALTLSADDLAALDHSSMCEPIYPGWYADRFHDPVTRDALTSSRKRQPSDAA